MKWLKPETNCADENLSFARLHERSRYELGKPGQMWNEADVRQSDAVTFAATYSSVVSRKPESTVQYHTNTSTLIILVRDDD